MQKGKQTRAIILYTAIEIIAENGLKDISTAKLAAAAGVSKSTIFHHFKSNDELLISALNLVFEELLQSMKIGEYRDVEHFLDTIGQSMFQASDTERIFVKAFLSFLHEGIFDSTYREILVSYAEQMNHFFRTQLAQLVPRSVNQETIDSVSGLLLPMIDGIGFHYLLNGDDEKYRQIWALQTKSVLQLLGISG
jgi:AcrR family transcriptional regulator